MLLKSLRWQCVLQPLASWRAGAVRPLMACTPRRSRSSVQLGLSACVYREGQIRGAGREMPASEFFAVCW